MGEHPAGLNLGNGLADEAVEENFTDLHPPLSPAQAAVEASRCYYCYDAPCIDACPTGIDIPTFIHQIRTGNVGGAARTILADNILGGTCARACPTEVLCEDACVRNTDEDEAIKIGELQRHAVDHLMASGGPHPFERAASTGRHLAVVGAGPAGLAFAHRAARLGHRVTVFDAKPKAGGLNEYGLAAYKMAGDFAQRELAFLLEVGGITIETGRALGQDLSLADLSRDYDGVFLGLGLTRPASLSVPGADLPGVRDALGFIEELRTARRKADVDPGRDVVVIGGGNTAIDAAIQARRLGAETATIVYRRGPDRMSATAWEQDLARLNGVQIRFYATPTGFEGEDTVHTACFARTRTGADGSLETTDAMVRLPADRVYVAIGQQLALPPGLGDLRLSGDKIAVDADYRTSMPGVFAGGDCIDRGEDLTVQAVEDGKRAALAMDAHLKAQG